MLSEDCFRTLVFESRRYPLILPLYGIGTVVENETKKACL
jgi:hypothetical protein